MNTHAHSSWPGISAQDIDILVTTSSVFAPTPSVASMLINMFKMREDVQVRDTVIV
jgi:hypothetical protein